MEIKSTNDQSLNKLNVLIYGLPGSGKTRFIGSAAKSFKTIIASAESGLLSLKNMRDDDGKRVQADFLNIEKFEDLEELVRFLVGSKHDYKCFGIDSGTEIQQVCMDYILRKENRDKPQLQDWGTLNNKMVRMIRYVRDMSGLNTIMTALSECVDQGDGTKKHYPFFQGRLQETVAAYFDIVAYSHAHVKESGTEKEETNHIILCKGSDKYLTKDRDGGLPRYMPNDFTVMYNHVFKGESK